RSLGLDRGLPFPLTDLARSDTLLLWGANPADTMPPLMQHVDAMRGAGGRLVVVDPRRTATAAVADLHLKPAPGSDLVLALGMLQLAVADDLVDHAYLEDRTTGWPEVAATLAAFTPDVVAARTGVDPADLAAAVAGLAAERSVLLTGRGPEQQVDGVDTVTACINLVLALGKVGRPASGWGCLTGQANGQGGREHGQKADQLPGYRSITDPAHRAAVAAVWGVDPAALPGPGRPAVDLLASLGRPGGLRALLVAGSELTVAAPDSRGVEGRLRALDLLAVLDTLPTPTASLAHVVLPVAAWGEVDGTTTNLEGRVQRRKPGCVPPAGTRSDLEVIVDLAGRLGAGALFPTAAPSVVFDELCRVSAGGTADYSGMSFDRLADGPGLHWPCPRPGHPGTPRVLTGGSALADGRFRLVAVTPRDDRPATDDDFPVWLVTGRHREAYNSGTQTGRLPRLADARPEPRLLVHPTLAATLGVADGDPVVVESRHGRMTTRVSCSDELAPGVVWAPIHWGGPDAVNALIGPAVDPVSAMPGFKGVPVRLRPAAPGTVARRWSRAT
ncbi:MAG TPA: molybdopterin oxidoreductase family protein, partial [Acidimicrobiales bacterium]|nr:molybdopterin oxidoreductase family protein [Acidimicrobiales bacterium]